MTPQRVPPSEVQARVRAFRGRLAARGLGAALVHARVDRFYLSGTAQEGLLWVEAEGDPVLWVLRDPVRARAESPLGVVPAGGWRDLWAWARAARRGRPVGIAAELLTLADLGRFGLSPAEARDVGPDLLDLRSRKSPWEVARLEETGRVAAEVYRHAADILRPGLTEAEFAGALFARAMALGHEGLLRSRGGFEAYSWHVLSGPNAALPGAVDTPMSGAGPSPAFPMGAGPRRIRRGEPVMVDFGVSVFGYQTDQTRTFCLGPPPDWLRELHGGLEAVHRRLAQTLRPGVEAGQVFAAGIDEAAARGLTGYLGTPDRRCRFVGHGVGLEIVEPPIVAEGSRRGLAAGQVIALEPKAVAGDLGGAGLEDTYLVGDDGPRPLAPIPLELIVV
ncbi:MAG: M24 family metallopeptidase [Deferrisomatales bacterium]